MSGRTSAPEETRVGATDPRPGSVSRRVGWAVAAVLDLVLLALVNQWPGWQAVPILTPRTEQILPLLNACLLVGAAVSLLLLVLDRSEAAAAANVLTTVLSLVLLAQVWQVFPFDFRPLGFDAVVVARVVLGFALAGAAIALVVQIVVLVRVLVLAATRDRP